MKETPLSKCEQEFLLSAVASRKRLDGREVYDYRRMKVVFGVDRGCCQVLLGDTRVMCQVSCQVTSPKATRPTDGLLFINLELSPMASPSFEAGRMSDYAVELHALLCLVERCLKESRCVDVESLCIMAGEKVWEIRLDIHILNHEGNLLDCALVAAVASLAHFRRPDVTVSAGEITVHSLEDMDPVPLSIHHMPLCVTFAYFDQGKYLLVDPSYKEECVMEGRMIVGMNKHREICTLHMSGNMLLLKEQVLRCTNIASVKVAEITELIKLALANDEKARQAGEKFGFAESVDTTKIVAHETAKQEEVEDISEAESEASKIIEDSSVEDMEETEVHHMGERTAQIGSGGTNTWFVNDNYESLENQAKGNNISNLVSKKKQYKETISSGHLGSDDSEEDVTVVLEQNNLEMREKGASPMEINTNNTTNKSGKKTKKKT